jgi:hypothetical protein
MADDPWHFARDDLAQAYFDQFDTRLTHAAVLFGPRRTGKTEFMLHDLGPLAQANGWRVAYASLWQTRLSPLAALIHALSNAKARGTLADRAEQLASAAKPKAKVTAGGPGAKAELELDLSGLHGPPSNDDLLRLDECIERFTPKSRRALLLIDEAQELAADPDNEALVAALRTSLDSRKSRLCVLFTGSSQDALRNMFSRKKAPFFQFGAFVDWPPLEDAFVAHMAKTFAKVIGPKLDEAELRSAFIALERNPFLFRKLLEIVAFDPARDVNGALGKIRARVAEDLRFEDLWHELSPLQRALLRRMADNTNAPFSQEALASLGKDLRAEPPSRGQVQAAMRLLLRKSVVSRTDERGGYAFNDPELAHWAEGRAL